ncbi:MAG: ABC transporter ATP-binding protein [Prevotella sp.]|nr:ABC transporter ATP-binding protein [Prevotella sp.]
MTHSITLRNLTIGYTSKRGAKTVVSSISQSICQGELTCLLGANGVGKSTLLRTLSAFQPALGGEILIAAQPSTPSSPLSSFSDRQLSRLIGVVLTEKPEVRNMTVRELVGLGRSPYTGFWGTLSKDDYQVVDDSLRQVGIEQLSSRFVDTLSDGERQKVMIAKALAQQTPIIFLDEPTAFLDFPSKVEVMQLLRRLARQMQKTIFMSTHDLELALQVADTIWLMEHDQLSVGTPRQLADDGTLGRFVERQGIVFDRSSLSVKVINEN